MAELVWHRSDGPVKPKPGERVLVRRRWATDTGWQGTSFEMAYWVRDEGDKRRRCFAAQHEGTFGRWIWSDVTHWARVPDVEGEG